MMREHFLALAICAALGPVLGVMAEAALTKSIQLSLSEH
jgi:hypothetical protein